MSAKKSSDLSIKDQIALMEKEIEARKKDLLEKQRIIDQSDRKLDQIARRIERAMADYKTEYEKATARLGERTARANGLKTLAEITAQAKKDLLEKPKTETENGTEGTGYPRTDASGHGQAD
jgi:exonuclease VII large subunit